MIYNVVHIQLLILLYQELEIFIYLNSNSYKRFFNIYRNDGDVAIRYRCLSCNRPAPHFGTNATNIPQFAEYPPNSLPGIRSVSKMLIQLIKIKPNKHSIRHVESTKRLESYHHWLQGDIEVAENLIPSTPITKKSEPRVAGGYKMINTPKDAPNVRITSSQTTLDRLRDHATLSPRSIENKLRICLNSKYDLTPPRTAPANISRKNKVDTDKFPCL